MNQPTETAPIHNDAYQIGMLTMAINLALTDMEHNNGRAARLTLLNVLSEVGTARGDDDTVSTWAKKHTDAFSVEEALAFAREKYERRFESIEAAGDFEEQLRERLHTHDPACVWSFYETGVETVGYFEWLCTRHDEETGNVEQADDSDETTEETAAAFGVQR